VPEFAEHFPDRDGSAGAGVEEARVHGRKGVLVEGERGGEGRLGRGERAMVWERAGVMGRGVGRGMEVEEVVVLVVVVVVEDERAHRVAHGRVVVGIQEALGEHSVV